MQVSKAVQSIGVIILLIGMTIWAYWPVSRNGFVSFDDPTYVTENDHVKAGLTMEGIKWSFTATDGANWHPLTWFSHMLDVSLFGKNSKGEVEPAGHHWMSVGIHIASAVLLFVLLTQMTGELWLAAFVAGLFALHPTRVESVAWAAERKDVLSTFFGFAAMLAYVGYVRAVSGKTWRYLLTLVCFVLSLLCKPMLVTLPCVLLLLDFWPLRRIGWTSRRPDGIGGMREHIDDGPGWSWATAKPLIIEKTPMLALSAASSVVTFFAQKSKGAVSDMETLSVFDRFGNAVIAYARYIGNAFVPVDLAILYPHPLHWPILYVVGALGLMIALTIAATMTAKRHPYFIVGWLWFVGTLVPVIGLVQVGAQSMADRYTYVAYVGLFICITWFTALVVTTAGLTDAGRTGARMEGRGLLLGVIGVLVLGMLGQMTRDQVELWRTSETIYKHTLNVTEGNWVVLNKLAQELEAGGQLARAAEYFEEAAGTMPRYWVVHYQAADANYRLGRLDRAIAGFEETLRIKPDSWDAMNALAWIFATQADPNWRNGARAVELAEKAAVITRYEEPATLDTLACAYAEVGRFEDAIKMAEKSLAVAKEQKIEAVIPGVEAHIRLFREGKPARLGFPKRMK